MKFTINLLLTWAFTLTFFGKYNNIKSHNIICIILSTALLIILYLPLIRNVLVEEPYSSQCNSQKINYNKILLFVMFT